MTTDLHNVMLRLTTSHLGINVTNKEAGSTLCQIEMSGISQN